MHILQAGVPKSGNYWLYRIINSIFTHFGLEKKSFIQNTPMHRVAKTWELSYKEQSNIDVLDIGPHRCYYRISSIFRMPIDDIDNYIQHTSVAWTHSNFCELSKVILPKFDKIIYIIRDPRDVALSMAKFVFTPYMQKYYPVQEKNYKEYIARKLDGRMKNWVEHVGGYIRFCDKLNIHAVFYENLRCSFEKEMERLLQYLDLNLDNSVIQKIKEDVDFRQMKIENPAHVRKGQTGQWKSEFDEKQQHIVHRVAGPLIELLNYPTMAAQAGERLPNLPARLDYEKINRMIRHAQKKTMKTKLKEIYRILLE